MTFMQAFDRLLAALVLALAAGSIAARDRFLAIAIVIAFSLNVALIWTRLGALDVALAEAAIGAGIVGCLLLSGWRATSPGATSDRAVRDD